MEKQTPKIGAVTTASMIFLALIFDAISLIPFVNLTSAFVAWLIFGTWFYLLGLGFANPRRIATIGTSFLIEFIPIISMIPSITFGVWFIIFSHNHPVLKQINKKPSLAGAKKINQLKQMRHGSNLVKENTQPRVEGNNILNYNNQPKKTEAENIIELAQTKTVPPTKPDYAKKPNEAGLPIPQQRRLPPDINPTGNYGNEEGDQEVRKAA